MNHEPKALDNANFPSPKNSVKWGPGVSNQILISKNGIGEHLKVFMYYFQSFIYFA